MGRAETWARAHKGLLALLAAAAAALGVLLFLLHPKGQSAAQNAISYIPAPFTPQPDAGAAASTAIPSATASGLPTNPGVWWDPRTGVTVPVPAHPFLPPFPVGTGPGGGNLIEGGALPPGAVWPTVGPPVPIKTTLGNVPSSSAVMGGVG